MSPDCIEQPATLVLTILARHLRQIENLHQDEAGPKLGGLEVVDIKKIYAAWKQTPSITVSVNPKDPLHFVSLSSPRAKEVAWFSSLGPSE